MILLYFILLLFDLISYRVWFDIITIVPWYYNVIAFEISSLWRRTPPPPEQTPGNPVNNCREDSLSQKTRNAFEISGSRAPESSFPTVILYWLAYLKGPPSRVRFVQAPDWELLSCLLAYLEGPPTHVRFAQTLWLGHALLVWCRLQSDKCCWHRRSALLVWWPRQPRLNSWWWHLICIYIYIYIYVYRYVCMFVCM